MVQVHVLVAKRRQGKRWHNGLHGAARAGATGHADDDGAGRHVLDDDGVGADARMRADANRAEDLRPRANDDVVFQRRVALGLDEIDAPQGHVVVEQDVIADLGCLADDRAHAVVDDQTAANACAGVDFDAGEEAAELRHHTPKEVELPLPQRVG